MNGFRAASDLLLIFGFLCLLPLELPAGMIILSVCVCSLACGLAFALRDKPVLRYGCGLFPILLLLCKPIRGEVFAYAFVIGYSEILVCSDRLFTTHWSYAKHLRFSLFAVCFGVLIALTQSKKGMDAAACFLGYLLFGAFFLRQLRLGGGVPLRGRLADFLAVIAAPAAVMLAGTVFAGGEVVFSTVFLWIATIFGILFQAVIYFLVMITPSGMLPESTVPSETIAPQLTDPVEIIPPQTLPSEQATAAGSDTVLYLLLLAGILFLAFMGILALLRFLKKPSEHYSSERWVDDSTSFSDTEETPKKVESNRRKIRRIYGRYLTLMRSKGYCRQREDTSMDILAGTEDFSSDPACASLRELYIRARYCPNETVSASDVQKAKLLYKKIRDSLIAQ